MGNSSNYSESVVCIGVEGLISLGHKENIGMHGKQVTLANSGDMCKVIGFPKIAALCGRALVSMRGCPAAFRTFPQD